MKIAVLQRLSNIIAVRHYIYKKMNAFLYTLHVNVILTSGNTHAVSSIFSVFY
jgi:hypothetical protein